MTAKEMFEKLNYKLNDDINNYSQNRYEYKRFNKTTKMFRTITIVNGENKKNKFIEIEEEFVMNICFATSNDVLITFSEKFLANFEKFKTFCESYYFS